MISAKAANEGVELGDVRLFVRCVDGKITVPDPSTMRSLLDDWRGCADCGGDVSAVRQ